MKETVQLHKMWGKRGNILWIFTYKKSAAQSVLASQCLKLAACCLLRGV